MASNNQPFCNLFIMQAAWVLGLCSPVVLVAGLISSVVLGINFITRIAGSRCKDTFPVCESEPFTQYLKKFIRRICRTCTDSDGDDYECCEDIYEDRCLIPDEYLTPLISATISDFSSTPIVTHPSSRLYRSFVTHSLTPLVTPIAPPVQPYILSTYNTSISETCMSSGRASGYASLGLMGCVILASSAFALAIVLCRCYEKRKSNHAKLMELTESFNSEMQYRRSKINPTSMDAAGEYIQIELPAPVAGPAVIDNLVPAQVAAIARALQDGEGGVIIEHHDESARVRMPSSLFQ